jgi:hypothetical protein
MVQPLFIFISYSRQDAAVASEIARLLERGGHDPFIDRELLPGQHWKDILQKQIDRCDAFVYVVSPASLSSEWCQWEFNEARRQKKPVFPIRVQAYTELPETVKSLGDIQILDMTSGINSENVVALMGGLFHVRTSADLEEVSQTEPSRTALRANPVQNSNPTPLPLPLLEDADYDALDGTEPLTRLPMPLKNPLPAGVSAILQIVESPTINAASYKIYTTKYEIGRSSKTDLQLNEKRISKHHLTLYWSNGRFRITDSSLNGTWLNGERLTSNQSYPLEANFDHHIDLAGNYTILNFRYTVPQVEE